MGSVLDSRTLSYTWDEIPCGQRGGEITKYHYQLEDEMGSLVKNGSVSSPTTTIAFDDLIPCSNYTFRVSATTASGEGPFTEDLKNVTDIEGMGSLLS